MEDYTNTPGVRGLVKEKSGKILFDLVTDIPESALTACRSPDQKVQLLIRKASIQAGAVSATLSCPGGFLGVLTILPDLAAIWRIQAQLVSDIAATRGKIAFLGKEEMVWCLFRHATGQLVRDIAVQAGSRFIVQKVSVGALRKLLQKIGLQASNRFAGRMLLRLFPVVGALGSGAYAFYDTYGVGKTADTYFKGLSEIPENELTPS
ncbi:MAG: EcsC family protein [Fibrobacter sp.]|jgi:hypothetical protein|nr:EcsC family protein [Fibrobacter sp.]